MGDVLGVEGTLRAGLLHAGRELRTVLALRRYRLDLSLPVALSHQSPHRSASLMATHDSSQPVAHEHHSRKPYYLVFAALMLGTTLTVIAAFYDLSPWNMPIALAIAAIKAICVILIF